VPPTHIKPIPIPILIHAVDNALAVGPNDQALRACVDMVTLGYYFVLRPGEYYVVSSCELSSPFHLVDVKLFVGERRLDCRHCTKANLEAATLMLVTFTNQKNSVLRGEIIGHGYSGHQRFCPVLATTGRLLHLHRHHAPDTMPLYSFYVRGRLLHVYSHAITPFLRRSVAATGGAYGVHPKDVEARSLRTSGAMALIGWPMVIRCHTPIPPCASSPHHAPHGRPHARRRQLLPHPDRPGRALNPPGRALSMAPLALLFSRPVLADAPSHLPPLPILASLLSLRSAIQWAPQVERC
jgi:hypothetical protein